MSRRTHAAWIALVASASPIPAFAQSLTIIHAKAWTMTAPTPLNDATITIDNGRIVSVVEGGAAPAGASVIDAAGRTVTPGLMNAATQLGLTEVSSARDTRDTAQAGADAGSPPFDVSYALNGNSSMVSLARSDGLTRALSFPAASDQAPFSGQAAIIRLRPGTDILDQPKVALFTIIGGGAWEKGAGSRAAQWQLLRGALESGRPVEAPPKGRGGIAAARGEGGRRNAMAMRQVMAGTLPLAIMTNRESDIRQAIALAHDFPIRIVIVGGAEAWRAAGELAAAHISVVLDPVANLPASFDQIGTRIDNAAILDKAGVTVAFGVVGGAIEQTYNAGLMLREGAGLAVANGLPYFNALKAITVSPASIWGAARPATLAAGSDGDVVVWDGDPLEPATSAVAVVIEGRQVSTRSRQDDLADRYGPHGDK